ncbi:MAG: glycosyltransferase family 4 protein [Bacteroidetes bacterium]|nr:glycosyltransferase family 4 protein [Bacteroidota bacterium]
MPDSPGKHVLLVVENCSVPDDQRVWKEAKAVKEMGFDVSIISPKDAKSDKENFVVIDDIWIYRYKQLVTGTGFISYFIEYLNYLARTFVLVLKINFNKRVNVFHSANPPDLFFLIFIFFKPFGAKYIFDVHDLFVNAFESKYTNKKSSVKNFLIGLLSFVEKLNLKFTDYIVVTNQSYKEYLIEKYRINPAKIFIVRNAPELDNRLDFAPDVNLKQGRNNLLIFFGMMGEDDGVDVILKACHYLITEKNFTDFYCCLIGPDNIERSPYIKELKKIYRELNLHDNVKFTGYLSWDEIHTHLNTADVGLSPDLYTQQNNISTMIKIMEYMSHGLPILSFKLKENIYSAGEAALYCDTYDYKEFAEKILIMVNDSQLLKEKSKIGLERYKSTFNWQNSKYNLVSLYKNFI